MFFNWITTINKAQCVLSNSHHHKEMKLAIQVQIFLKEICTSLCANDLGKGMNSFILLPAKSK